MGTPIEALLDLANLPPVRRRSRSQVDLLLPAGTSRQIVVALLAADKAQMGDVFYQSVGARADVLIDRWHRQQKEDQR